MNSSTAKIIDDLLSDSGLFSFMKTAVNRNEYFDFSRDIILITGAAGTIGSELTKQLVAGKYQKIILVDFAESPLYNLIKDLEFENTTDIVFKLLDITDKSAIESLFSLYNPTLIFHAAAYKHVPLMEENPYKAVKNNILGTKLLADLSIAYKVKKFVFVSTDKAVKPINIMGMSKRICEDYLNHLNTVSETTFITTRFGNIMGSNGSVIPLLKTQIESGKNITLTNTKVSRYFISKQKACQLILKISTQISPSGNTFTFNMGDPIKIKDIVERLLFNYNKVHEASNIKVTKLRVGEKLTEDLVTDYEQLIPTDIQDVYLVETDNNNSSTLKINYKNLE
ncbi:SDR family NAD(P)-dependent oxidoreductase [Tamlana sp. s12]|uniref:SDR family NAD(P)-dependent oxidoreductase n=1 Tax=Tamlana sp. s12 TaxID=1630406 RepID=UPI000839143F|nr:SDR family NAD(P)-dependent oxidoreductase [Tamlana sp. s12]QQY81399.1 SDR family NAD(P)-dependent oxidoreductase [Tamlana sp. s12]